MRLIKKISKLVELSKWFNRKSQHYVLGNWACYTPWSFNFKKMVNYRIRYPIAWVKFMWYSRKDIINA